MLHHLAQPAELRAAAVAPCGADPERFCGTVDVPLDRAHPSRGTVPIYFEFDPQRSGPWNEAIVVTEGGPGLSVTQDQFLPGFYRELFDPVMETRGLILLDQRGVGLSDAIDCPELQQGDDADIPYAAVAACGRQLGFASPLYGSGDVARDVEAVRRSLGIPEARPLRRLVRGHGHPGLRLAIPRPRALGGARHRRERRRLTARRRLGSAAAPGGGNRLPALRARVRRPNAVLDG